MKAYSNPCNAYGIQEPLQYDVKAKMSKLIANSALLCSHHSCQRTLNSKQVLLGLIHCVDYSAEKDDGIKFPEAC